MLDHRKHRTHHTLQPTDHTDGHRFHLIIADCPQITQIDADKTIAVTATASDTASVSATETVSVADTAAAP